MLYDDDDAEMVEHVSLLMVLQTLLFARNHHINHR